MTAAGQVVVPFIAGDSLIGVTHPMARSCRVGTDAPLRDRKDAVAPGEWLARRRSRTLVRRRRQPRAVQFAAAVRGRRCWIAASPESVRVVSPSQPGFHTLLVDCGRPAAHGISAFRGGAADRAALAMANGLVGTPPEGSPSKSRCSVPAPAEGATACASSGALFTAWRTKAACRRARRSRSRLAMS